MRFFFNWFNANCKKFIITTFNKLFYLLNIYLILDDVKQQCHN